MTTYILLLRGVMPSGKNKVPMAQLRDVLVDAGFGNVRTYIQSGNALVDTGLSALETESLVHDLINEQIGPDLAVVARTSAEVQQVLLDNPFQEGYDLSRVFFVLFARRPAAEKVKELLAQDFGEEKLVGSTIALPHLFYLLCSYHSEVLPFFPVTVPPQTVRSSSCSRPKESCSLPSLQQRTLPQNGSRTVPLLYSLHDE